MGNAETTEGHVYVMNGGENQGGDVLVVEEGVEGADGDGARIRDHVGAHKIPGVGKVLCEEMNPKKTIA